MILIILIITFGIFLIILFFKKTLKIKLNKKFFKNNELKTLKKNSLNKWMNLTKKERYNLSKKESFSYMHKRKVLLEEIRNEYKKMTKSDSKKA